MVVKLKLGNIVNVIGTHHGIELYLDRIIWLGIGISLGTKSVT